MYNTTYAAVGGTTQFTIRTEAVEFFEKDFGKILKHNALQMRRLFIATDTDCGRVYDRNLEQYPVTVDLYGQYVRITDYSDSGLDDERAAEVIDICRRMLYVEKDRVILQRRPKREGREQHELQDGRALAVDVKENGLTFRVDLTSHIDTGLFLDQVKNRMMVRSRSAGADVLNLFSYTGSFSVYAAAGGARSVTSVDLSNTYTAQARDNLNANGYSGDNYACICADALQFVTEAASEHRKYDIIVFDPPCFSNSRKMDYDFDVQRDYGRWLGKLYGILRKGGFILFCTNLTGFRMNAALKKKAGLREITVSSRAEGFTHRQAAVRSWILEKDDDFLTLDWDDAEPADGAGRGTSKGGRVKPSPDYGKNEWKPDRPRRDNDRRPVYRDRDDGYRGDRPRRDYRREGSERDSYRRDDKYRRDDSHRRDDGGRDSYRRDDGYRSDGRRRDYDARPRREGSSYRDDYKRDGYKRDGYKRDDYKRDDSRRREDSGEYRNADRPRRDYRREDRERDYRERPYNDRPRREYRDSDRPARRGQGGDDRKPAKQSRPYGYDSFKPARDRKDSKMFFWLDEEDDKKDK